MKQVPEIGLLPNTIMIEVCVVLLLVSTSVMAHSPPYVESSEAFMSAKTYISENLPPKKIDIHKKDHRVLLSFGMLTAITAGQVLSYRNSTSYEPLVSLYKYFPLGWVKYQYISLQTQSLLNEATQKASLITELIDTLCGSLSVEECNELIDNKVKHSPHIYRRSAQLLLSLGVVSKVINDNRASINGIAKRNHDIPYLLKNVSTVNFKKFVRELNDVYEKLQQSKFRRLYDI